MAAACCRLPVWGSRRPCDRAKMDACTMRVGKLQSYLLPSFSSASMLPNASTAKRTQRILTTPPVAAQFLSVLWGTWVQSTSINVKYYLPLYSVLLSIYRGEPATLFGRLPASSNPGNLHSSKTSVYLHSSQLAMSGLLRMKYTHTSTRVLSRHLSVFCWCPFVAHFDKWTRTGHFRRAGLWLSRSGFQTGLLGNEHYSSAIIFCECIFKTGHFWCLFYFNASGERMFKQGSNVTSRKQHLFIAAQLPGHFYPHNQDHTSGLNIYIGVNLSLSFFIPCGSYSDFNSSIRMEVVVVLFEHLITYFPLEPKVKPYVLPPCATGKYEGEESLSTI